MFLLIFILLYCNSNISYTNGLQKPKFQNKSSILQQLIRQPNKALWTPTEEVEEVSHEGELISHEIPINKRILVKNNHKKSIRKANTDQQLLNQYHRLVSEVPVVRDSQVSASNTNDGDSYHSGSHHDSGWPSYSHHHKHHHHHDEHHTHKGHEVSHGWGHHHYADYALIGLSALALGTFLLNSLWNLLSLAASYLFTVTGTGTGGTGGLTTTGTGTGGTVTTTGGTTTGGTSTSTGGGTITVGSTLGGVSLLGESALGYRGHRKRRSVLELKIDTPTSFDVMSHFILNSIEAMMYKQECIPYLLCQGNKQAKVIGDGFQYIIPWFSFVAVYKGKEIGLLENFSEHIRAIISGLSEANCRTEFPKC